MASEAGLARSEWASLDQRHADIDAVVEGSVRREAGRVRIGIFDARGRRVVDLLAGNRPAGPGLVRWDANGAAPGVYFARLELAGAFVSRPVILVP